MITDERKSQGAIVKRGCAMMANLSSSKGIS